MVRLALSVALGLMLCVNAQAALLAKYSFATDLSPTFVEGGVSATAIDSPLNRLSWSANDGGTMVSTATGLQTFVDAGSFTVSSTDPLKTIKFDSIAFDLRALSVVDGEIQITNNVNADVFTTAFDETSPFVPKSFAFTPNFYANSVTFTIARRATQPGSASFSLDNLEVNGVIPEPASMAVFGVLGLAGFVYRRRMNKA